MSKQNLSTAKQLDKSLLMTAFNKARHSGLYDARRLNRALGYLMAGRVTLREDLTVTVTGTSEPVYYVNKEGCDCADHIWRQSTCKHILCRLLLLKMEQLRRQRVERATAPTPEEDIEALYGTAA